MPATSAVDHSPSATERAVEFGKYLATAAEAFMKVADDPYCEMDDRQDAWRNLNSAIYEFRKRAARSAL